MDSFRSKEIYDQSVNIFGKALHKEPIVVFVLKLHHKFPIQTCFPSSVPNVNDKHTDL